METTLTPWHKSLSLRLLLPLLLVLSSTSLATFFYSEKLLEQVILDQVRKQAEVFLIGLERQIQTFATPLDRKSLEPLFQQVLQQPDKRYSFSVAQIYLYRANGEVVAHSDLQHHAPKEMNGKYGAVIESGLSYLDGPLEEKENNENHVRSTDIIIPIHLQGKRVAALEAELDITRTEQLITSIDDEFEAVMRMITLISALLTAAVIIVILWTQLIRPARAHERILQQSIREKEALNRAKDDFLSSMSHELRTPLSTMIGYHQLLLGEKRLDEHYREMIQDSLTAGKTLLHLVNDILDMSKIRSGKFELEQQPFDLKKLIRNITRLMERYEPEKEVTIQLEIDPAAEPYLEQHWIGDEIRITQILFNLLSNAIKFSPTDGKVTLTLQDTSTQGDSSQHHFLLCIADQGIGMNSEMMDRLFTPFEQADSSTSRRFGGTGLGLYISQQLASLMGGEISVESTEGIGSRFCLSLLLAPSTEAVATEHNTDKLQPVSSTTALSGSVLLAEDTVQLQRLTTRILKQCNVSTQVAPNGIEAVKMGQQGTYDLILMDMQMPEMDGIEATRRLREAGCSIPIIALSANVMPHHQRAFSEAGGDGFLTKPIDPDLLCSTVAQYLQPAEAEHGHYSSTTNTPSFTIDDEDMEDFWEDLLAFRQSLVAAFDQQDWQQLANTAHAIKGMGGSFGFPEITALAAKLESSAHSEEHASYQHDYHNLNQHLLHNNPLEQSE